MLVPFFFPVNDIEICFHGMARSGNHAVLDWIASMYPGKVDFWNNVATLPFKLWFRKKSFLLRSHENRSLAEIFSSSLEQYHDLYFGKTRKRFNVLLVRDPFNLFASRLQQVINQGFDLSTHGFLMGNPKYKYSAHEPHRFIEIWKEHAREYLGTTSYLPDRKVTIDYNRWVVDRNYRQQIAASLELPYSEDTISRVVGRNEAGAGSSFDGYDCSGEAAKMRVFERWKKMADNENYRLLFSDSEIWTLSDRIFGSIAGTECLR